MPLILTAALTAECACRSAGSREPAARYLFSLVLRLLCEAQQAQHSYIAIGTELWIAPNS
jgi:hypothetical protein